MAEKEPVRYENTAQGLIQVNLGYLSDRLQLAIDIGAIEKDDQGRWIAPVSTPGGLPSDLSPEQFEEELKELSQRLRSENQIEAQFVLLRA